jgi:DNA repair exonuclease SbcCD ATPase subunit
MSDMAAPKKDQSPLVQTVVALDHHFLELERIGRMIHEMKLRSDSEFEYGRRLMGYFAEAGEGVTLEITTLSKLLNEARARAEQIGTLVEARTEELSTRRGEHENLSEQFEALALKVGGLSGELNNLKRDPALELTAADRVEISAQLAGVGLRLGPFINEAVRIRNIARAAKIKSVDQKAESMTQTLQNLQTRLNSLDLLQA